MTTKSNALGPLAGEPQYCDEYGIGNWADDEDSGEVIPGVEPHGVCSTS
jgi:hypothetical protein